MGGKGIQVKGTACAKAEKCASVKGSKSPVLGLWQWNGKGNVTDSS